MPADRSSMLMPQEPRDDAIAQEAAAWLARNDRGLSAAESREFAEWRAADPRHAAEFERIDQAWHEFSIAKEDPELVAMAQALERDTRMRQPRRQWWYWTGGLAAAAAIAVVFVSLSREPAAPTDAKSVDRVVAQTNVPPASYKVVPSVARQMTLPDGSMVTLRGDSEVRVEITPAAREVRLVRGEAFFTVTPDAARPFVVNASAVAVRAVGTAFNVRLETAEIEVLVTEGKVCVDDSERGQSLLPATIQPTDPDRATKEAGSFDPTLLLAGNRAVIALDPSSSWPSTAHVAAISRAEVEQEISWQNTFLVFNGTPLAEVVEAFNRHGPHRLKLGDPSIERRQFGGTFRADNPEGFIRLLEKSAGIRAERSDDGKEFVLWPE